MKNILQTEIREVFAKRAETLTEKTAKKWGKMNATQMLAHLNEAFRISLGMKKSVDVSNFYTRKIMFPVVVYVLPFWPHGEKTATELDVVKSNIETKDFYTELAFFLKFLEIFSEREAEKIKPHPMFGALTKKQWADLFTKHIEHHFKQFGV